MDALRQAIFDTLNADGTLTTALATYRTEAAIVDGYRIPEDMEVPLVQYSIVADTNFDSKSTTMRVITVDFDIITSVNDDPITVAERVRTLLHRVALTVTGWTNIVTEVNGPVEGRFDEHMKTAELTVEFTLTC